MAILQVQDVKKYFGGLKVLTGVTFSAGEKEKLAIIGPNGAGKTTLFNIVSGKLAATAGKIEFQGRNVSGDSSYRRARSGMARSFQITNIFQKLSAIDNVLAGVRSRAGLRHHLLKRPHKDKKLIDRCEAILDRVGLLAYRDTPAQDLAYGQQRALELAVTLSMDPRLILLDEPTAGMSRQETSDAITMIQRVTRDIACVIIEHDMNVIFSLANRIAVLHYGTILACDAPDVIRNDQRVKDAYLGEEAQ